MRDFEDFFPSLFGSEEGSFFREPSHRIEEEDQYYRLSLDVPGVDPKNIRLKFKEGILSISSGESSKEDSKNSTLRKSRSFKTSFSLPSSVDGSRVSANVENGVMDVILPKRKTEKAKEIPVGSYSSTSFFEKIKKQLTSH